jgi:Mce-associated membrane protein
MRRTWLLPTLLALTLVGLLAASTVIWLQRRESLDNGAVAVAREQAQNFFSLDYRHAPADVDKVLGLATGTFKEEYASKRDEVVDSVTKKKLVVTASIPKDGAAVEFLTTDRAQVLVAVDVTTTTTSGASEEARYRTRIQLAKVDGSWFVSSVNQVG